MPLGMILVLTGAVLFSAKAVVVKLTYQYQISALTSLFFRMLVAFPFLLFLAFWEERKLGSVSLSLGEKAKVVGMGILGYYGASYFDFLGLQYITAGLERIILFVYPTLVVVLSRFLYQKPISSREITSLVLTYLGVGIAYGSDLKLGGVWETSLGAGFVFLSALSYALYLLGSGSLIPKLGALRFTAWALLLSSLMVFLQFAFFGEAQEIFQTPSFYGLVFLLGTLHTVVPAVFVSLGIERIGSKQAALVASVGPVSTLVLAYFLLAEPLTWMGVLGTVFVLFGVFWISQDR